MSSKTGFRALPAVAVTIVILFGHGALAAATGDGRPHGDSSRGSTATGSPVVATGTASSSGDSSSTGSSASGSNLEVVVPPAPSQNALPRLCRAFLRSADQGDRRFQILVGATGGTYDATTAWCGHYLSLTETRPGG